MYNTLELLAVFNPAQTMSFRLHVEKELGEPSERARAEARSRADALRRSRTAAGVGVGMAAIGRGGAGAPMTRGPSNFFPKEWLSHKYFAIESYYFRVLNKIYLSNFLYGWIVNHEMNLMSLINS